MQSKPYEEWFDTNINSDTRCYVSKNHVYCCLDWVTWKNEHTLHRIKNNKWYDKNANIMESWSIAHKMMLMSFFVNMKYYKKGIYRMEICLNWVTYINYIESELVLSNYLEYRSKRWTRNSENVEMSNQQSCRMFK